MMVDKDILLSMSQSVISPVTDALSSHVTCFLADKSRLEGKIIDIPRV